jgi:hypothetical protein
MFFRFIISKYKQLSVSLDAYFIRKHLQGSIFKFESKETLSPTSKGACIYIQPV